MRPPPLLRDRAPLLFGVLVVVASAAALASCSESGDPPTVILRQDSGPPSQPRDASTVPTEAGPRSGTLRLVHAARGLPTLDFCTRSGPQDLYAGPVLGGGRPRDAGPDGRAGDAANGSSDAESADADAEVFDSGPGDAAAVGVSYLTASQYVSVVGSGTVEVAVVPSGTGSCAQPLAVGTVTLEPGKLKTAVVHLGQPGDAGAASDATPDDAGDASTGASVGIAAFDDVPGVTPNRATLRLIYASGGAPPLTATLYATLTTTLGALEPLSTLRAEPDAASVDTLGYATVDPGPPPTTVGLRERGAASASLSAPGDLGLTGGSLHTGFVVRDGATYTILYCNDVSTDGPRTQCFVLRFP